MFSRAPGSDEADRSPLGGSQSPVQGCAKEACEIAGSCARLERCFVGANPRDGGPFFLTVRRCFVRPSGVEQSGSMR